MKPVKSTTNNIISEQQEMHSAFEKLMKTTIERKILLMKTNDTIMGFADFNEKKYPFIYEDDILKLFPTSIDDWRKNQHDLLMNMANYNKLKDGDDWIGTLFISAVAHNGNDVSFFVSNDSFNNNGFISFSVIYYYEYRKEFVSMDSIRRIDITGREINDFYNPAMVFETEVEFDDGKLKSTRVKAGFSEKIQIGTYRYKEHDIVIYAEAIPTLHMTSENPLSASSRFVLEFSDEVDMKTVIEVFYHCNLFFCYVCGRTNIDLDDVQVFGIRKGKVSNEGVIHISSNRDSSETDMKRQKKSLKYDYIKNGISEIFTAISDGSLYLEHLRQSINATHSYGIERVILNFVAFEREFRNLYDSEIIRSDEYSILKEKVLEYLKGLRDEYTGKQKKYVNGFISTFGKAENKFADKMKKALDDCEEILLPFLHYNYSNYNKDMNEDICDRMNKLRNDSAHGNIDLEISPINISDFLILEALLYAMRLKHAGVDTMDIRRAIRDLKNYSTMISEKE